MRKWICALVALLAITANAKVTLPKFFADNMVLQQQSECNIWGWAEPGTKVVLQGADPAAAKKAEINIDEFFSVQIKAVDGKIQIAGKNLLANNREVVTIKAVNSDIG